MPSLGTILFALAATVGTLSFAFWLYATAFLIGLVG